MTGIAYKFSIKGHLHLVIEPTKNFLYMIMYIVIGVRLKKETWPKRREYMKKRVALPSPTGHKISGK